MDIFERIGGWINRGVQDVTGESVTDMVLGDDTPEAVAIEEMEKAKAIPTTTIGSSMIGPMNDAGETVSTDRTLNMLGAQRWVEFERMVRDITIIAAGLRLLLNLISNAVWTVNPPEGLDEAQEKQAQEYADLAYDMLFDMTTPWSKVVRKVAMYMFKGFSLMEWTAKKREDGAIGLMDVEHRPQQTIIRWIRDKSGTVEAVVQRVNGRSEVVIPREKLVYAVDDLLTDSPEGMGLMRHLASTAERLRTFLALEEVGFETDLRGIPVARAPLGELLAEVENAGPAGSEARLKAEARRQRMLRPMRDFIQKHIRNKKTGVLLPSDTFQAKNQDSTTVSAVPKWALELLNGESQSFEDMANAINRMNQEMARVLGVEHLMLGSDGSGSLALARSKVGTFYMTVTSALLDMLEVFDQDLIGPIAELNGWPPELTPQMGVNEISDRDIEQITAALRDMATAGAVMMPDDPAIGEIRDMLGLSRPPEDGMAMDLALTPQQDPNQPNPDDEMDDREKPVAKVVVLKSRRNMAKSVRRAA